MRIRVAEALQLAIDSGLKCELSRATIQLRFSKSKGALVWRVGDRPPNDTEDRVDTHDWRYFEINASSGELEVRPRDY